MGGWERTTGRVRFPARDYVANMDILFVEDHEGSGLVVSKLLTGSGHRVMPASGIEEALALLDCLRFDALVSDISLPDGSGMELVAQAKKRQPFQKAVALSSALRPVDRNRSLEAGFDECLTKPVDLARLRALLL